MSTRDPTTLSLWQQEAGWGPAPAPLSGEIEADVCVVGGGLVGLWTAVQARRLEPTARVVLLDATRCGAGASGRNGGFCMTWASKLTTLSKVAGAERALRLLAASADAVRESVDLAREYGGERAATIGGWTWLATNAAQIGAWEGTLAALAAAGQEPFEVLGREEAVARTGCGLALGGVHEPAGAVLQPALLTAALRALAERLGVTIHEGSPVRACRPGATSELELATGRVRAAAVAIATGAWTAQLVSSLRRDLVVVASDVVATEPDPAELDRIGVPEAMAISDSRLMVNYWHRTRDGRIVLGTGGHGLAYGSRIGRRFLGASPVQGTIESNLRRLHPTLMTPIARSWSGAIDRSELGVPLIARLGGSGSAHAAAGFSGNGVGPSRVIGGILAALALDHREEGANSGLVREPTRPFPPEPLRFGGGQIVRRAVARKERFEDEDRAVGTLCRRAAALAPAGLVPTTEPDTAG